MADIVSTTSIWPKLAYEWTEGSARPVSIRALAETFSEIQDAITYCNGISELSGLSYRNDLGTIAQNIDALSKMRTYCNGIHYELVQRIDAPLADKFATAADSAYACNPETYTVTRTWKLLWIFDIPRDYTIFEVFKASTIDGILSSDFKDKFDALNEDEPSDSLNDAIITAHFWQAELQKAEACKKAAEDVFGEDIGRWNELTAEERQALAQEYIEAIQPILSGEEESWVANPEEYMYVSDTDMNGLYGSCSDEMGNVVRINDRYLSESDPGSPFGDPYHFIDTITHESRHALQNDISGGIVYEDLPGFVRNPDGWCKTYPSDYDIQQDFFGSYWTHPTEEDARGFAAISRPDFIEGN